MQIINKHSLTVVEVTARERREEFKGEEWIELQSYISALRAERDELREALEEIANAVEHLEDERMVETWGSVAMSMRKLARAVLAKYAGKEE